MTKKSRNIHRDRSAERRLAFSRRHFLRGVGACVALPAFGSLTPLRALAADSAGEVPGTAPLRMAFVTFPNGVNQSRWWPTGSDADFQFNTTMLPLEGLKKHIQVISGLDHLNATDGNDGGGDHARANATLLTGVRAKKTSGANIHLGVSIDQVAARHVGHLTRFPSLELTCDDVRKSGYCDNGYSCAYQFNVSWRSATTPMPPEPNPRLVFERLFGSGTRAERHDALRMRQQRQRSILDFVLDDARSVQRRLGHRDQRKLDEYLTSVREIERRIEHTERMGELPDPEVGAPKGIPPEFEEHMALMYDMMLLAFQTDSTRIATLMLAYDGSNRPFPRIGIAEGHHFLSHHENKDEMLQKVGHIDQHYVTFFTQFLQKLASTQDVDGRSLLDNSMIVYACGNADGNRHTHDNLPVILAGGGGGSLHPGRFLKVPSQPMCNLYLSMLDRLGVEGVDHFGDSDNRVVSI